MLTTKAADRMSRIPASRARSTRRRPPRRVAITAGTPGASSVRDTQPLQLGLVDVDDLLALGAGALEERGPRLGIHQGAQLLAVTLAGLAHLDGAGLDAIERCLLRRLLVALDLRPRLVERL